MRSSKVFTALAGLALAGGLSLLPVRIAGAIPPDTTVLIPAYGATVSGTHVVLNAVGTATGSTQLNFELNGAVIATATPTLCCGWLALWNSTTVPNGTYFLDAVLVPNPLCCHPGEISITVANPTANILIPSNGATLSGSTTLDAAATNATSVDFYLFGGSCFACHVGTATPTLYGWLSSWNTHSVANGSYTLFAAATNNSGTTGLSTGIGITVQN